MSNELFQARLPDDFAEEIHEYREDNHMSKSEAVRHLLRAGLEAEATSNGEGVTSFLHRLAQPLVFFPSLLIAFIGMLLPFPAILAIQGGNTLIGAACIGLSLLLIVGSMVVGLLSLAAQLAIKNPQGQGAGAGTEVAADE
jgi:hypothetical protein